MEKKFKQKNQSREGVKIASQLLPEVNQQVELFQASNLSQFWHLVERNYFTESKIRHLSFQQFKKTPERCLRQNLSDSNYINSKVYEELRSIHSVFKTQALTLRVNNQKGQQFLIEFEQEAESPPSIQSSNQQLNYILKPVRAKKIGPRELQAINELKFNFQFDKHKKVSQLSKKTLYYMKVLQHKNRKNLAVLEQLMDAKTKQAQRTKKTFFGIQELNMLHVANLKKCFITGMTSKKIEQPVLLVSEQDFKVREKLKKNRRLVQTYCRVCFGPQRQAHNPMRHCKSCGHCFHSGCYSLRRTQNRCFKCFIKQTQLFSKYNSLGTQCDYCSVQGLLYLVLQAEHKLFYYHPLCLSLTGNVVYQGGEVFPLDKSAPRAGQACFSCSGQHGQAVKCFSCVKFWHPMCAYFQGLSVQLSSKGRGLSLEVRVECCLVEQMQRVMQKQLRRQVINYEDRLYKKLQRSETTKSEIEEPRTTNVL